MRGRRRSFLGSWNMKRRASPTQRRQTARFLKRRQDLIICKEKWFSIIFMATASRISVYMCEKLIREADFARAAQCSSIRSVWKKLVAYVKNNKTEMWGEVTWHGDEGGIAIWVATCYAKSVSLCGVWNSVRQARLCSARSCCFCPISQNPQHFLSTAKRAESI